MSFQDFVNQNITRPEALSKETLTPKQLEDLKLLGQIFEMNTGWEGYPNFEEQLESALGAVLDSRDLYANGLISKKQAADTALILASLDTGELRALWDEVADILDHDKERIDAIIEALTQE